MASELSFSSAFHRYRRARSKPLGVGRSHDRALAKIDDAFDALMSSPCPSKRAFGIKILILEHEYGLDAQPRHIAAIYADVALLATLYAAAAYDAWPA